MAVLNKLRNSTWVLIVVLVSLGLFVASDYFSSQKYSFGGDQNVGEIDGKPISYLDYDAKYKQILAQITDGSAETEEKKDQAAMYAWNQIIQEFIIDKEYDKLGIDISDAEAGALLYSENAHPTIKQYFSQDGQFSPSNVTNFVKAAKKDPRLMSQFELIVGQIITEVKYRKYNALVSKSLYATSLDAEDDIIASQTQINGKSITLNFATIDDKTIKYTDEDLKTYINNHKEDFKQKASRDIEYILVDVSPTSKDTMALVEKLAQELPAFNAAENDSDFVTLNNSLTAFDTNYQSHGRYSKEIEAKLFSAKKDSAFGPVYYDGAYSLFKVIGAKKDSVFYYHAVKAEVSIPGTTKADTVEAMAKAKRLLAEASSSSNALDFFNSKTNTGEILYAQDLGWLRDGSQLEEVNKAVKGLSGTGGTTVQTPYGISIVKLVEPKSSDLIKVAELRWKVEALKETDENALQKASDFKAALTGNAKDDFEKTTKKFGLNKSIAINLKESDKTVTSIPGTRDVIRWVFNDDRKEGDVSEVISCENLYIVAKVSKIKEEGTASIEDVREKVTRLVINEKKAELLKAKFEKAMKSAKTMEQIAMGVESIVQPFNNINFYATSIPFAGNDQKLIGFICGLKVNQMSRPYTSNDGVHIFLVENSTAPQIPADLSIQKSMLYGQKKQQIYNTVTESLKRYFKVKDERYKFF